MSGQTSSFILISPLLPSHANVQRAPPCAYSQLMQPAPCPAPLKYTPALDISCWHPAESLSYASQPASPSATAQCTLWQCPPAQGHASPNLSYLPFPSPS